MKWIAVHCVLEQDEPDYLATDERVVMLNGYDGDYGKQVYMAMVPAGECRILRRPEEGCWPDAVVRARQLGEEDCGYVTAMLPDRTVLLIRTGQVCETPWGELIPVPWDRAPGGEPQPLRDGGGPSGTSPSRRRGRGS